jgi:hypothetical protein
MADGAYALGDRVALPSEVLMLLAISCHVLLNLLQARCHLWRTAQAALCRLTAGVVEVRVHPVECLFCLRNWLAGSPLLSGHWGRDGLAQFILPMEDVRRVMRPKVMFPIGQQARSFIAG